MAEHSRFSVASSLAAVSSAAAGVLHLRFGPSHFEEDVVYGVFFYGVGTLQVLGAIGIGAALARCRQLPSRARWLALMLNGGVIAVWAVTRAFGPVIGADAGRREAAGYPDVLAVVLQIVSMAALVYVARAPSGLPAVRLRAPAAVAAALSVVAAVPLVAAAAPATHPELCEAHEDETDVGPLAAVYAGHVMLAPPFPTVQATIGQAQVALVGELINCAATGVVVSSAATVGYQDPVPADGAAARIVDWSVGPLYGSDRRSLSQGGVVVPATTDEAELGLFVTMVAERPGDFNLHNVAVDVRDEGRTVRQTFATVVRVEVARRS